MNNFDKSNSDVIKLVCIVLNICFSVKCKTQSVSDSSLYVLFFQMVKMMIILVIIYAFCWLPFHTITLIGERHPTIWNYPYSQVIWISCHWFAMSNCCYNPMVYCWMNSKFRNGFRYVLRYCPCVTFDYDEHGPLHKGQRVHTYVTTMRSPNFSRNCGATVCKYTGSLPGTSRSRSTTKFRSTDYTPYCRRHISETIPLHNVGNGNTFYGGDRDVEYVGRMGGVEIGTPRNNFSYRTNDQCVTETERTTFPKNTLD